MRRQKRIAKSLIENLIEGLPEGTEALPPDEAVARVLTELGRTARNVFLLYMKTGDIEDIAIQTGLSKATVYRNIVQSKARFYAVEASGRTLSCGGSR